jgi:catechol 2,3-dioxygenase-like lactoylglutathione lyase family enzyme
MSNTQVGTSTADQAQPGQPIDMKLEVVVIPVTDVARAANFYAQLGWRLDADISKGANFRIIQFTPPGSDCSIHFGTGLTAAKPGSMGNLYLVVSDIEAARKELVSRSVEVSKIFHRAPGEPSENGLDPQRRTYSSYATFADPDGNTWLLQEITARLPGRVSGDKTTFNSVSDLESALKRAAAAHGEHEKRIGKADEGWPRWYAEFLVREHSGQTLPL